MIESKPPVAIVLLNWNGWRDTRECLQSLLDLEYSSHRIFIIDNGSTDDSIDRLKDWASEQYGMLQHAELPDQHPGIQYCLCSGKGEFYLVAVGENLGFAGGCNVAARILLNFDVAYAWFLNNDAIVTSGTLTELVACSEEFGLGIVGSLVYRASADSEIEFAYGSLPGDLFGWSPSRKRIIDGARTWASGWVTFASALVSRACIHKRLQEDGYFLDEDLFMYVEDVELGFYCARHGIDIGVSRDASVFHRTSSASGGLGSPRTYFYITRNRILVARKWLGKTMFACFLLVYVSTRSVLILRHAAGFHWERIAAVISGVSEGLRGKVGRWRHH